MSAMGPTGQPTGVPGIRQPSRAAGSNPEGKRREQEARKGRKKDEVTIEGMDNEQARPANEPPPGGEGGVRHIDLKG